MMIKLLKKSEVTIPGWYLCISFTRSERLSKPFPFHRYDVCRPYTFCEDGTWSSGVEGNSEQQFDELDRFVGPIE